jgi:hypothetical protein
MEEEERRGGNTAVWQDDELREMDAVEQIAMLDEEDEDR